MTWYPVPHMKSLHRNAHLLRVPSHDGNSTAFTANPAALSLELSFKRSQGFKGLEVRQ